MYIIKTSMKYDERTNRKLVCLHNRSVPNIIYLINNILFGNIPTDAT